MGSPTQAAADALFEAREKRKPVAPIRDTFSLGSAADGYAVQEANTKRWLTAKRKAVGRKIGLTSRAIQQQLGVDEPDYGILWSETAFVSGDSISVAQFMQPRIEAEIAFMVGKPLDREGLSFSDVASAIDHAFASVEIVDSAVENWNIRLVDTIADNASYGGFILGTNPRSLGEVDLELCGMVMTKNGEAVSLGVGAACLGHPLRATLWLARKMVEVGRPLAPGDLVLSGALGPMVPVAAGDQITVQIQGFTPVTAKFTP